MPKRLPSFVAMKRRNVKSELSELFLIKIILVNLKKYVN